MNYEKGMDQADIPPAVLIGGVMKFLARRGEGEKKRKRKEETKNKMKRAHYVLVCDLLGTRDEHFHCSTRAASQDGCHDNSTPDNNNPDCIYGGG